VSKNKKYEVEYIIRSSPSILYNFLTTPSGLVQWFADDVDINDNEYSFTWDGVDEKATVIEKKENHYIRFQWENRDQKEYFEFRIENDEITGDTALIITDFADDKEIEDQKRLWNSQVNDLIIRLGA